MLDLNLITVIEDGNKNNAIAGVGISMPSMARAMQKCRRGRLLPFGWWHVLRALKAHKSEGVDLLLVGFLPEYRTKGANALLFADLIPRYIDYGFRATSTTASNGARPTWRWKTTTACRASGARSSISTTSAAAATASQLRQTNKHLP